MNILAFSTSPRSGGNTEIMLDWAIRGIQENGGNVEVIRTHDINIESCSGCGYCEKNFRCNINDDFQKIFEQIILCDGVIFAVPLYFMNIPGRGKSLIDRFQCFWITRSVAGIDLFNGRKRGGILLSCSGAEFGPNHNDPFRGLMDTMKYVFESVGIKNFITIFGRKIDTKSEINNHPDLLEKSYRAGLDLNKYPIEN